jgi:alpha-tubulin suppressor-like RCC1 family protein
MDAMQTNNTRWTVCTLGAIVVAGVGCSGRTSGSRDDIGSATIAITQAPADATCLQVTVTGTRTAVRLLDLMPGESTVFTLSGLPLGADTFGGSAFNQVCSALDATSVPTWASDPVPVTLAAGVTADVTLILHRASTGRVSIDFPPDGTGGAMGAGGMPGMTGADGMTGAGGMVGMTGAGGAGTGGSGMPGAGPVQHVAAGTHHSCAIIDQAIECWGDNTFGQLGDGTLGGPPAPRTVALGNATGIVPVDVTAGGDFSCALLSDGGVKCWGRNNLNQVGIGSGAPTITTPAAVGVNDLALGIASGETHTCALRRGRDIVCWGGGSRGQLGYGGQNDGGPVTVAGINDGVSVTAGEFHSCATRASGTVLNCWGDNTFGQLGDGDQLNIAITPVNVVVGGVVEQVAAGSRHTCAIVTNGTTGISCWGSNQDGAFGDGTNAGSLTPKAGPASLRGRPTFITAGGDYTCALLATMGTTASCWGSGFFGQLGNGASASSNTPVDVASAPGLLSISAGPTHACSGRQRGVVECWGQNNFGEIGDGTTNDAPAPTPVAF